MSTNRLHALFPIILGLLFLWTVVLAGCTPTVRSGDSDAGQDGSDAGTCDCLTDADCYDGNPCTDDVCTDCNCTR